MEIGAQLCGHPSELFLQPGAHNSSSRFSGRHIMKLWLLACGAIAVVAARAVYTFSTRQSRRALVSRAIRSAASGSPLRRFTRITRDPLSAEHLASVFAGNDDTKTYRSRKSRRPPRSARRITRRSSEGTARDGRAASTIARSSARTRRPSVSIPTKQRRSSPSISSRRRRRWPGQAPTRERRQPRRDRRSGSASSRIRTRPKSGSSDCGAADH